MKVFNVVYTRGYDRDARKLAEYIAKKSSKARAQSYIASIVHECNTLSWAAYRGTKRSYLPPNLRVIGFKRAVSILFRIEEPIATVVILGISYRGWSFDNILKRNE
jgi:toxin ParE1/3/4